MGEAPPPTPDQSRAPKGNLQQAGRQAGGFAVGESIGGEPIKTEKCRAFFPARLSAGLTDRDPPPSQSSIPPPYPFREEAHLRSERTMTPLSCQSGWGWVEAVWVMREAIVPWLPIGRLRMTRATRCRKKRRIVVQVVAWTEGRFRLAAPHGNNSD